MDVRAGNDNLRVSPPVFLDIRSFLVRSPHTKELYIPHPYNELLQQISLFFNIWALRPVAGIKIAARLKSLVLGSNPEDDVIGRRIELPVTRWIELIQQHGTPLFYMHEPSDPLVLTIPANMRRVFPANMEVFKNIMLSPIPDLQSYQPVSDMDRLRKLYSEKAYAKTTRSKFAAKLNDLI